MNARKEFLDFVAETGAQVKCASIEYQGGSKNKCYLLKVGYSDTEYEAFLSSLAFYYDDGYGGQQLYGVIWFTDGTWAERGEHDGSEWWEHIKRPAIPKELKK